MASTRRRIALIAAPVALLWGLSFAPSAAAIVYCVPNNAVHASCQTQQADLQAALDAAEANAGNDTVRLGAGMFTGAQVDGFRYFAGMGKVDIIGAGQGQTTLTIPADPGDMGYFNETLRMDASGGGSTVSDLTVTLPAPSNNDMFGSQYKGVVLNQGQVNRVTVTAPVTPSSAYGFWVEGGPVTIADATVNFPAPGGENAVIADGAVQITDSDFTADNPVVIRDPAAATHSIDRTNMHVVGNFAGVDVEEGTVNLSSSVIDLGAFQPIGVRSVGNTGAAETATINLDHVTIAGTDPSAEGVRIQANDNAAADTRTATLTNSVISGPGVPIRRTADQMDTANVTTDYSNYNAAASLAAESNGANGMGMLIFTNQTNFPPGFVNLAMGDYHLASTSQLLDIGNPMAPAMGALDIDGNSRALSMTGTCAGPVAGRRDIGADEFVPAMPAGCPGSLTPAPAVTPATTVPPKKKCKKGRKLKKGKCVKKKKRR